MVQIGERGEAGLPIMLLNYFFIVVAELLAHKMRRNNKIKAIKLGNSVYKISQLTDNMVVSIENMKSIKDFTMFESFSVLKVNIEKKNIGSYKNKKEKTFRLDWCGNKIETQGVTITGNNIENYNYNFKPRIHKLKNLLHSWKGKDFSLQGN